MKRPCTNGLRARKVFRRRTCPIRVPVPTCGFREAFVNGDLRGRGLPSRAPISVLGARMFAPRRGGGFLINGDHPPGCGQACRRTLPTRHEFRETGILLRDSPRGGQQGQGDGFRFALRKLSRLRFTQFATKGCGEQRVHPVGQRLPYHTRDTTRSAIPPK